MCQDQGVPGTPGLLQQANVSKSRRFQLQCDQYKSAGSFSHPIVLELMQRGWSCEEIRATRSQQKQLSIWFISPADCSGFSYELSHLEEDEVAGARPRYLHLPRGSHKVSSFSRQGFRQGSAKVASSRKVVRVSMESFWNLH